MTDKVITVSSYGIALLSENVVNAFLKENKIRSKKILKLFQENQTLYLDSLAKGVWIPILPIDSTKYSIKISNLGEAFGDEWEKNVEEQGFNLNVEDSLWIASIGLLSDLAKESFNAENISYETLDGNKLYQGFKFHYPSGKYTVKIEGYRRTIEREFPEPNYGYLFTLDHVEEFQGYKDPRQDDKYFFNVAQIK
ncbi:hypothetical protein [Sphingobacterium athyrii]|uniref:Uncharacterized protein n=1 Tax=Sphingobacterium athyrii TaxID=2152717 RepID=A0A363NTK8_9SPHI|nr:hypothetical protein [Sphingobacterium athyrii]PUV24099.1 hypothetical protein DCO56_12065 [Sphingobacterium athyrii]